MKITLEYIWIDGKRPTPALRSKTKIVDDIKIKYEKPININKYDKIPYWGFDGSSTQQATGDNSDCILKPVKLYKDPLRKHGYLVLCEVYNVDETPHISNTRHKLANTYNKYKNEYPIFGIEQEYTFFKGSSPLGFPLGGFAQPQGNYYCGIGADEVFGRDIVEEHMMACIDIGLMIEGINAEVMPGQWEFQIGAGDPLSVSDDIWIGRYLLYRIAAKYGVSATLYPKPVRGDWNGAGAHTNFSTKLMREDYKFIEKAIEKLKNNHTNHIIHYGENNHERLTGEHETCSIDEFRYGVSDRGASIRIPWQVFKEQKGYIEDRRPAANIDPYIVTSMIINTVCSD